MQHQDKGALITARLHTILAQHPTLLLRPPYRLVLYLRAMVHKLPMSSKPRGPKQVWVRTPYLQQQCTLLKKEGRFFQHPLLHHVGSQLCLFAQFREKSLGFEHHHMHETCTLTNRNVLNQQFMQARRMLNACIFIMQHEHYHTNESKF